MAHQWVNGVPIFRCDPQLPVTAMKTFEVRTPSATHFERVSCEEVDCRDFRDGWVVGFDVEKFSAAQELGRICTRLGKKFTVRRLDNKIIFTFASGQACLNPHRERIDRPPIYIVRGGDWRGNPRGEHRTHRNAADFTEDWQESQAQVFDRAQRG